MAIRCSLAILTLLLFMSGCSDRTWHTKDISALMPPLAFRLIDENGRAVDAEDYRGKPVLLFFGYTHCPDVCPTTLARLESLSRSVSDEGRVNIRIVFVSVDPARDDPAALRTYTNAFGPAIIGLTGNKAALDALTRRYRITYGYGPRDSAGNYDVSHSGGVFAFDRHGQARLLIRDSDSDAAVVADLKRLTGEDR